MINVSNIERFATHDGPGIRTTVFLKGCPLHCPWCANPETWSVRPVLMYKENNCIGCRHCEQVCRNKAISWEAGFCIDHNKCDACEDCVRDCPGSALSINGESMQEEKVIEIVLRDNDYYQESGGGVTFSGGEPLLQKEGILKLLRLAKEAGLHTAVETTGNYDPERLKQAEKYIDLFLFDIKHTDKERLRSVTGANPDLIFANFEYLCAKRNKDIIARMPVIPEFNDDSIDRMIQYALSFDVREVNLLPYHNLGKNKWHQLQRKYDYEDDKAMKKETLQKYVTEKVKIGG